LLELKRSYAASAIMIAYVNLFSRPLKWLSKTRLLIFITVAILKRILRPYLNIDKFKAVNDTHGHDVGDSVIAEVANRIRKNVRNVDIACRYGGWF